MKFKVGDLVKITGYSGTINVDVIEHPFIGGKAKIESVNTLRDNWMRSGYKYKALNGNLFREDQLELLPICRTEIYKALTEGE